MASWGKDAVASWYVKAVEAGYVTAEAIEAYFAEQGIKLAPGRVAESLRTMVNLGFFCWEGGERDSSVEFTQHYKALKGRE